VSGRRHFSLRPLRRPPRPPLFPYTTLFRSDVLLDQREQEQVVLGAAGDHVEAALDEHLSHGLGVLDDLLLVFLEFRLQGFLEAEDRKSTRLNSSHVKISYAVFCLKKKSTSC